MPAAIVLLCPPADGRHLATVLSLHNPALSVTTVSTAPELAAAMESAPPDTRLVAFLTGVVVPAALLDRLPGPAYNFHPGPPAYPGKHPVAFALYDGAVGYGATAHEMVARTDSGAIVGAVEFPIPPGGATAARLAEQAYGAAIRLFLMLSRPLATLDGPLPRVALSWGERRCSQRALDSLRDLPPGLDREEFDRRLAAFSAETGGAPFVTLHGRRFVLEG